MYDFATTLTCLYSRGCKQNTCLHLCYSYFWIDYVLAESADI